MAEPPQECFSRFPKNKVSPVSRLQASGSTVHVLNTRAPEGEKVVLIDISSCFFIIAS